ncbi:hypothetical protein AB0395_29060 [Streptosporangium sp. NPDC051023]|uniref:hypothetical protein n=1 Tax=Streptosporangium sp. NPDC051023 TaxID=3155410 RepID=UPI00344EB5B7
MESEAEKPRIRSGLVLVFLGLSWLLGTPYLFLQTASEGLRTSESADSGYTVQFLIATAAVGVITPMLAAIVAGITRRKVTALLFGIGAVLCLLVAAASFTVGTETAVPLPPSEPPLSGR